MQSLAEAPVTATLDGAAMPRFQDGTINMQELLRQLAESIANEIMDAEADQMCGEGNSRNGYRERKLSTCVGTPALRVPKLRQGTFFPEDLSARYQRTDRALVAAVAETCSTGTSTRKVERVARKMGVERLPEDQVSAIAHELDADVEELLSRDLGDVGTPYLWLDATYVKCRREGRVASTAVVTAIGCDEHGWRHVLGVSVVDTEPCDSWLSFPRSVRARGVRGVRLVTSDAHEGLRRAIQETFQGAAWQRCVVHLMRDCAREAKSQQPERRVYRIVAPVFRAKDADQVRVMYHLACEMLGECCPRAARVFEEAEPDALAYLDLPQPHRRRLRTNNVQERTNREIKRRSRVVQVFPSEEALTRLVGAIMCEQDEEWAESRYFSEDRMAELSEDRPEPSPPSEERGRELLLVARQAIEASLALADRMEAA
ncbi:IS256 family transposase [Atopobiaceae bacterium LCP21S3_F7]